MARILTIDNDPAVLKILATALGAAGHETLQADGGAPGMDLARNHAPDLVICDVVMPNMDGRAFLTWLRNDPTTAGIPVILITGYVDQTPHRVGMNLGADDYLAKPFPVSELLATVESRLKKQESLRKATQHKMAQLSANLCSAIPTEFLTPLSDIYVQAGLLRRGAEAQHDDEMLESVGGIERSATRLYYSIQGYLFYADVELVAARPARVEQARFAQTGAAHEVVASRAATVAQRHSRGADLRLDLSACPVPMDRTYLAMATEILVGQAFLCSAPATPVKVSARIEAGVFRLAVQDQGRAGRDLEWNPVAVGNVSVRSGENIQGPRLGIATVRRLAEIHGGMVKISSGPGPITTMVLEIPVTN